jgi:hypothetical protein
MGSAREPQPSCILRTGFRSCCGRIRPGTPELRICRQPPVNVRFGAHCGFTLDVAPVRDVPSDAIQQCLCLPLTAAFRSWLPWAGDKPQRPSKDGALDMLFHLDDHESSSVRTRPWMSEFGCEASVSRNTRRSSDRTRSKRGVVRADRGRSREARHPPRSPQTPA